jgi:cytochrome c biogenesis protein CcmG/thiol:disulfide interchange protein DsbE
MIKKLIPIILFLTALFVILFRGLQLHPQELPSAQVGKALPSIKVFQVSNQKLVNLSSWYGKPFLIHFWASWCDNCTVEIPALAKYKKIVPIIGVDYKDRPEDANRMMALWGDTFGGLVHDEQGKFGFDLGVVATPETFLIDNQGLVNYRYQGSMTEDVFNQEFLPRLKGMGEAK